MRATFPGAMIAVFLALAVSQATACRKREQTPEVVGDTVAAPSDTPAEQPRPEPQAEGSAMSGTMTLMKNIPAPVGEARLAAGNFWEEDDDAGKPKKGLTAQVWVMEKDTSKNTSFRIHPGQEFDVTGAHVRVVAINADNVVVAVSGAKP
jgi:hypothetical protein